jgi:hypothetical protein
VSRAPAPKPVQCHFEDGIAPQHVVAVGIAGDNRQHAKPQDLIEPMSNLARLPRILQASRQPRFRRRSTSWNSSRPPSAEVHRSSIRAETGLSPTGDRLGRTSVSFSMVGERSPGLGLASTPKSYVRSGACATPTARLIRRPPS